MGEVVHSLHEAAPNAKWDEEHNPGGLRSWQHARGSPAAWSALDRLRQEPDVLPGGHEAIGGTRRLSEAVLGIPTPLPVRWEWPKRTLRRCEDEGWHSH